jgi:cephalosporin hydroxylase
MTFDRAQMIFARTKMTFHRAQMTFARTKMIFDRAQMISHRLKMTFHRARIISQGSKTMARGTKTPRAASAPCHRRRDPRPARVKSLPPMSDISPPASPAPSTLTGADVVRMFHQVYWQMGESTWKRTSWMGVPTLKCPADLWVYQEILFHVRPRFVLETGTCHGGTALFLAHVLDHLGGEGRVVSVDIAAKGPLPEHPRLSFLTGSSTDPAIVRQVHDLAAAAGTPGVVILDSDHSRDHVLAEMRAYQDLVTPGSYLIVEDTNVNGHPIFPEHGPGPMEAVQEFMQENHDFQIDRRCERFLVTFNPSGFLRRRDGR